jgi:hypothetical protein
MENSVARQEDRTHSATAERPFDLVAAEPTAGLEAALIARVLVEKSVAMDQTGSLLRRTIS